MRWLLVCALVGCGSAKITAEPLRIVDASPDVTVDPPGADSGPQERSLTVTVVQCTDGGALDVPGKLASDLVGTTVCAHHQDGTITCPHQMSITDGHIATSLVCNPQAINPVDYLLFAVPR